MAGTILFAIIAGVAISAAIGLLTSDNAVHAALFLVVNFVCVALIYLGLNAPFLAVVQITVYAGAIMVLFLFVIMLLGAEKVSIKTEKRHRQPIFAAILVFILFVTMAFIFISPRIGVDIGSPAPLGAAGITNDGFGSPAAIGDVLFVDYVLPFYVVGLLLLVAMIGAVVLTRDGFPVKKPKRWEEMLESGRYTDIPEEDLWGDA